MKESTKTGLIPCMGGFCASRDKCAHYHSELERDPVERLCGATEEPEEIK